MTCRNCTCWRDSRDSISSHTWQLLIGLWITEETFVRPVPLYARDPVVGDVVGRRQINLGVASVALARAERRPCRTGEWQMTIRGFVWRMATRRWDIDVKFNVLKNLASATLRRDGGPARGFPNLKKKHRPLGGPLNPNHHHGGFFQHQARVSDTSLSNITTPHKP
jgi:hypothetical protein